MHYLVEKFGKGRQNWNKACMDGRIRPKKLNTPIKTRLTFKYKLNFIFNLSINFII